MRSLSTKKAREISAPSLRNSKFDKKQVTAQVNVEGSKTGQARSGAITYSFVTISGLEKKN